MAVLADEDIGNDADNGLDEQDFFNTGDDVPENNETPGDERGEDSDDASPDIDDSDDEDDDTPDIVEENEKGYFVNDKSTDRSKKSKTKKRLALILSGTTGFMLMLLVGFLMFMTLFRSEHLRNLFIDYRFARFHYQIAQRTRALMQSEQNLRAGSVEELQFGKTTLGQKMVGYSPEKAFNTLKESGMELEVTKGKITGFTDTDGTRITSDDPEFNRKISERVNSVMEEAGHNRWFQRNTRGMLKDMGIEFGDRFEGFKSRLKSLTGNKGSPTKEQIQEAQAAEDFDTATRGSKPSSMPGMEDVEEGIRKDLKRGSGVPSADASPTLKERWAASETRASINSKLGSVTSKVSTAVLVGTIGCMVRNVATQIDDALSMRLFSAMRLAGEQAGEAEQLKSGTNVSLDQVEARAATLDGTEKSAAVQRINGVPESEISSISKMQVADLPLKVFGFDLKDVMAAADAIRAATTGGLGQVPGIGELANKTIDEVCAALLTPEVQWVIAGVELVAGIITASTAEAPLQALKGMLLALPASLGKGFGIGLTLGAIFGWLIPKFISSMQGGDGIMAAGDPQNGNKLDVGYTLLARQYGDLAGGGPISVLQASRDQQLAMAAVRKQKVDEMGWFAYISPRNPYSLLSQLSLSLPSDPVKIPGALISKSMGFLFSSKSYSSLGNIITPTAHALGNDYYESYGVDPSGISDEMMAIDPIQNAIYVDGEEGNLNNLKTKYQHCFTATLPQKILHESDYSNCSDEGARRLGLYNIDLCGGAVTLSEGVTANNCSVFDGAGDVNSSAATGSTASDSTGAAGTASTAGAANISTKTYTGTVPAGAAQLGDYKVPSLRYDWKNIYMTLDSSKSPQCQWTDKVPAGAETRPGLNQPGVTALNHYVNQRWGGGEGIHSTCNGNGISKHSEGRAWDSTQNAGDPNGLKNGNEIMGWMVANAQALGLQYVKFWRVEWDHQQGFNCVEDAADQSSHHTHVHWELNWDGALMKTPFFNGAPTQSNPIQVSQEICPIVS